MASKLDQPLDAVIASNKRSARTRRVVRRGGTGPRPNARARSSAGPVGGIRKNSRPVKRDVAKVAAANGSSKSESKIIISNLPSDVKENQVKEYFQQAVAPVRRVILSYGPNGASRGIATVVFANGHAATKAVQEQSGIKVDGKPMKIDIVIDGKDAPAAQEPKKLSDRISQPRNAGRTKTQTRPTAESRVNGNSARTNQKQARGRGKNTGTRTKKTTEELDAEMTDYFATNNQENAAPAVDNSMDGDI